MPPSPVVARDEVSEVFRKEQSRDKIRRRSRECVRCCNGRFGVVGNACGGVYIVVDSRISRKPGDELILLDVELYSAGELTDDLGLIPVQISSRANADGAAHSLLPDDILLSDRPLHPRSHIADSR